MLCSWNSFTYSCRALFKFKGTKIRSHSGYMGWNQCRLLIVCIEQSALHPMLNPAWLWLVVRVDLCCWHLLRLTALASICYFFPWAASSHPSCGCLIQGSPKDQRAVSFFFRYIYLFLLETYREEEREEALLSADSLPSCSWVDPKPGVLVCLPRP